MKRCVVGVVLLLLAGAARAGAQEPMPPSPPPAPPPAWVPYAPAPGPSAAELDALEAEGHHEKHLGVALMATGGGLAAVGTGLIIAGAWQNDHDHHCYDNEYYRYGWYYNDCNGTALTVAGATTTLIGVGTLVPGIVEYVRGGSDVDAARAWRRRCGAACWRW